MSQKTPRQLPSKNGFFQELSIRAKLILRLMGDKRVNIFLKILPFGSLIYLFFPDVVIGPIDDALLLWISTTLFVELCPQNVVNEHLLALEGGVPVAHHDPDVVPPDVVDGQFQVFEDEPNNGKY